MPHLLRFITFIEIFFVFSLQMLIKMRPNNLETLLNIGYARKARIFDMCLTICNYWIIFAMSIVQCRIYTAVIIVICWLGVRFLECRKGRRGLYGN